MTTLGELGYSGLANDIRHHGGDVDSDAIEFLEKVMEAYGM